MEKWQIKGEKGDRWKRKRSGKPKLSATGEARGMESIVKA